MADDRLVVQPGVTYGLVLLVHAARFTLGAEPEAHLERILVDTGFRAVHVVRPGELLPAGIRLDTPVAFPEWLAVASVTWPDAPATLRRDLGDFDVLSDREIARVAPGDAPPRPPASPTPAQVGPWILGGLGVALGLAATWRYVQS